MSSSACRGRTRPGRAAGTARSTTSCSSRPTRRRTLAWGRALRLPHARLERSARAARRRPAGLHDLSAGQGRARGELFDYWQSRARAHGLDGLYFVAVQQSRRWPVDVVRHFDAIFRFQPAWPAALAVEREPPIYKRYFPRLRAAIPRPLAIRLQSLIDSLQPTTRLDYERVWQQIVDAPVDRAITTFEGAYVDWDNTARYGKRATVYRRRAGRSASSTGSSGSSTRCARTTARRSVSSSSTPGTNGPKAPTSSPTNATATATCRPSAPSRRTNAPTAASTPSSADRRRQERRGGGNSTSRTASRRPWYA